MDPIGVDDGEHPGTGLGLRTQVRGVVAKLDDLTSSSKRRLLEIRSVPFLCRMSELYHSYDTETYLDRMDGVKSVYSGHAAFAKKKDSETIDTTVSPLVTAEFALVRGGCENPPAFKSDLLVKERLLFSCCP